MNPWWLRVGCVGRLFDNPLARVRRMLKWEAELQAEARERGMEDWVSEWGHVRLLRVRDYLMDPGYSREEDIRAVQRIAHDVFGEAMLSHYLAEVWPFHLALLKAETLLHVLTGFCWLLTGLLWTPDLKAVGVFGGLLGIVLIYVEFGWSAAAKILRRLFFVRSEFPGVNADFERRSLLKGLRWWQRPAGRVLYPLARVWRRRYSASDEPG